VIHKAKGSVFKVLGKQPQSRKPEPTGRGLLAAEPAKPSQRSLQKTRSGSCKKLAADPAKNSQRSLQTSQRSLQKPRSRACKKITVEPAKNAQRNLRKTRSGTSEKLAAEPAKC
jgi:hypothetical protein